MTLQRIDTDARMSDAVIHHQTLYYTSVAADAALDEDITSQAGSAPVRCTVQAVLMNPRYKIEIIAIKDGPPCAQSSSGKLS